MSGVKNWLMEMQEYSHHLIDTMQVDEARKHFVNKYGKAQEHVFNDVVFFYGGRGLYIMEELDALLNLAFFLMTLFELVDVNVLIIEGTDV